MEVRAGHKKMGQKEKKYVHMLNSTLCATTRTLSCILENFQTPTGVKVPEVRACDTQRTCLPPL